VVVLLATLALLWALTPTLPQGRIAPGVRIAGRPVGGMTPNQAAAVVSRAALSALGPIRLDIPTLDRHLMILAPELGLRPDTSGPVQAAMRLGRSPNPLVAAWQRWLARRGAYRIPLQWRLDTRKCRLALGEIAGKVNRRPRSARARWDGSGIVVTPEAPGIVLRVEDSLQRVAEWNAAGRVGSLTLAAGQAEPEVTAADLAPVDGVVARYTTHVGGTANRLSNVRQAASAINGVVVMPGRRFSYNRIVGPRTTEAGYKTAPVIVRGKMVTGIGGGACQVSSTLYNAVLLANLRVVRRTPHSHPIGYVPAGQDATVVYGAIDLVFENQGETPVVLQSALQGRRLTILVLGKTAGPPVRVFSTRRRVAPAAPVLKPDPTLAPGQRVLETKASSGARTVTYRVVGDRREVVSRDYYPPTRAVYRVGPAPAPGQAAPEAPEPGGSE